MRQGFRVFELVSTPLRSWDRIDFGEPGPNGLRSLLEDAARTRLQAGERNERTSTFTRFDLVRTGGLGIFISTSGGLFGEHAEIVDSENGSPTGTVSVNDAILREFRTLLLVPSQGDAGLLIAEVRGRSHHTPGLLKLINYTLQRHNIKIRVYSELTDAHAWTEYIASDEVGVRGVELAQKTQSPDRTTFTNENVKKSTLRIDLDDSTEVKNRLTDAMRTLVGRDRTHPRLALSGVVGLRNFTDEDFDEEKILAVVDGREKKINVSSNWPSFVYDFESEDRPENEEFMEEVLSVAERTMQEMNVDLARDWRPKMDFDDEGD